MDLAAWISIAGVSAGFLLLALTRLAPDLVLFGVLVLLLALGVVAPAQALAGFANPGLVTVVLLSVLVTGVRETGGIRLLLSRTLDGASDRSHGHRRVLPLAAALAALFGSTPVVSSFMSPLIGWARRFALAPSRMLLPLSYAAILGGTCSLFGSSAHLVVNGLYTAGGARGLGLFELAWIGLPLTLAGLLYLLVFSRRLLPARDGAGREFEDPRQFTVEMEVIHDGPLVGKSVEAAGLRHLTGLFLIEINRGQLVLPSVASTERLQARDHLIFAGMTESVVELHRIPGLQATRAPRFSLDNKSPERCLVEVAIAPHSELVGYTLREARFRSAFGASVIAVARRGERVHGKLGDIRLQPSDTLLVESERGFVERHRHSRDFLMISEVAAANGRRYRRGTLAWGILAAVLVAAGSGLLELLQAALLGAAAMLVTGCCSAADAWRGLNGQLLLTFAAAFGLAGALETSGAATAIASTALGAAGAEPWLLLALSFVVVAALSEAIGHSACAVVLLPVVLALAAGLGVSPLPFVVATMLAASANFASPRSYQTNLMVYGPGGYRLRDYLRFGLPLKLLAAVATVGLAPLIWPF